MGAIPEYEPKQKYIHGDGEYYILYWWWKDGNHLLYLFEDLPLVK